MGSACGDPGTNQAGNRARGEKMRQITWKWANDWSKQFVKILILVCLAILSGPCFASVPDDTAVKILIAEGANQGADGMTAIGEVLRRRDSTRGFCALKRGDLEEFIDRQGPRIRRQAKLAWDRSKTSNLTRGATHYENVEAFGRPAWAKSMRQTAKIGDHTFFA